MLTLTIKDICTALDTSKYRVRTWIKHPPFLHQGTQARIANKYNATDLLMMATLQTLEDTYGVNNDVLSKIMIPLYDYLSHLRIQGQTEEITINLKDFSVSALSYKVVEAPSIILNIKDEHHRIENFLFGNSPIQKSLPLSPVSIRKEATGNG